MGRVAGSGILGQMNGKKKYQHETVHVWMIEVLLLTGRRYFG